MTVDCGRSDLMLPKGSGCIRKEFRMFRELSITNTLGMRAGPSLAAARWAPSSFNTQQWRALYARRGTEHWQTFFDLLVDANKAWAKNAAVLVVFISRRNFDHNDEPSVTHSYDCGAAWENFALQGFHQGLVVHGMQGFDYDRARRELRIPEEFQVEAMAAVGRPGPKELLPEKLQARESPNDRRKISESVFEGPFRAK